MKVHIRITEINIEYKLDDSKAASATLKRALAGKGSKQTKQLPGKAQNS